MEATQRDPESKIILALRFKTETSVLEVYFGNYTVHKNFYLCAPDLIHAQWDL